MTGGSVPLLRTPRLLLRAFTAADVDRVAELVGDIAVARNLARVPWPYGREDARHFVMEIAPSERVWAIVPGEGGVLAGAVGVTPGETLELGYWIGRPFWGQGIATEAARAVVAHVFASGAAQVLTSGYFADNPASGRVLAKLGFVESGMAERPCLARGAPQPSCEVVLDFAAWRDRIE